MAAIPLEQTDLVADCRRRNAEFVCGLLEAHVPRRGLKGPQLYQGWKLSHGARVDEIHSAAHEIFAFAFAITEMEKGLAKLTKEYAPWYPSPPLPKLLLTLPTHSLGSS